MKTIKKWLNTRTGRLVQHDLGQAILAGVGAWYASGHQFSWVAIAAAGTVAFRVLLRYIRPIPAGKPATLLPHFTLTNGGSLTTGSGAIAINEARSIAGYPTAPVEPAGARLHLLPDRGRPLTGRRVEQMPAGTERLATFRTKKTWPKVAACNWATAVATYFMLLNDQLGDCTIAALLDMIQTWCAVVGVIFTPTNAIALAYYEKFDGYIAGQSTTDNGGQMSTVVSEWHKDGVSGHKIDRYVAVDLTNRSEVEYAIATFGGLYVGVQLTQDNYQKQGVNWGLTKGPGGVPSPDLGHCIYVSGFDSKRVKIVTWAQDGTITWGCFALIADQAYAAVSKDFIAATGVDTSGLNEAALLADLESLAA